MSFGELYDCAFKNLALKRFSSMKIERTNSFKGKTDRQNEVESMVLDHLMNSTRHVIFYLISASGGRASELIAPLKNLQDLRNRNTPSNFKNSPARIRRFFGVGHKSKKKKLLEAKDIEVVVLDVDPAEDAPQNSAFTDSGWYSFTTMGSMAKSRLLRTLNYQSTPSLIVVDTASRQVICTDGRRAISEDLTGVNFPWPNPTPDQLFQGPLLKNAQEANGSGKLVKVDYNDLPPSVKGLYFGANWCPPCRQFTKQLIAVYKNLRASDLSFEIIFCSSDRSEESFEQHFSTMPWLAYPFDHEKLTLLTRLYNVNGIPAFLILDERNNVITRHGRNAVLGDVHGKFFPWGPQLMYELNEYTLCRLRDIPSLILFTEGTPEDVSFSVEVLRSSAEMLFAERKESLKRSPSKDSKESDSQEEDGGSTNSPDLTHSTNSVNSSASSDVAVPSWADPLQVFYTGEDPLCDLVLEGLGLGEAELPMVAIVDVIGGRMAVCQKPDVSAEIVEEFILDFKGGKLEMTPLPSTCQNANSGAQIGGIPIRVVHQVLGIGNSPSQSSLGNEKLTSPTAFNGASPSPVVL